MHLFSRGVVGSMLNASRAGTCVAPSANTRDQTHHHSLKGINNDILVYLTTQEIQDDSEFGTTIRDLDKQELYQSVNAMSMSACECIAILLHSHTEQIVQYEITKRDNVSDTFIHMREQVRRLTNGAHYIIPSDFVGTTREDQFGNTKKWIRLAGALVFGQWEVMVIVTIREQ